MNNETIPFEESLFVNQNSKYILSILNEDVKSSSWLLTNGIHKIGRLDDKEIILADIPGLIEGAHSGSGLGIKFLKHIERCKTLLHLIDVNEDNLINIYKEIRNELKKYSKELVKKNELIVFNKIDLIDKKILNEKIKKFENKIKKKVLTLSTLNKSSVSKIKSKLINYVS